MSVLMIIQDNPDAVNCDKATYTLLMKNNVLYCGDILYPAQQNDLIRHGSTTISETIVKQLGNSLVIDEVYRITNKRVSIHKTEYGYILKVVKEKKEK